MANPQRKRLGEVLLEAGVIDGTQLQAALGHQRRWGGRIGQALVDLKMATEEQIVATLAEKLGFPRVDLEGIEYGPALELALRLVPHEFAERNQLVPYAADPTYLWVAMADPTNIGVIDELAFRTGRHVKLSIAGDREIARAVRRLFLGDHRGIEAIALDERDLGPVEMVGPLEPGAGTTVDDYFPRSGGEAGAKAPPVAPTASTPQPPPPGAPPPLPARPGVAP
ncbi:MAG TPA: general secretion pathway protein GspE, partial [Anaeromyxobacteraceae bacterium]|nr:general secretion pathway protein GspE [Anaeromyxobacteraceae bacterium]